MVKTENGFHVDFNIDRELTYVEGLPSLLTQEAGITRLYSEAVSTIEKNKMDMFEAFFKLVAKGFGAKTESDGEMSEEEIIEKLRNR